MRILEVTHLALPEVAVIRIHRYHDHRGYFAEQLRLSSLHSSEQTSFLRGLSFVQSNESFSRPGTIRGLHFQWNPYQGKLVRVIYGRMLDLAADIRPGSPTFGQIIAYAMAGGEEQPTSEWIWLPPGFAHGICAHEPTLIEYACTGEYNPACEAAISPLAGDLDWSRCDPGLRAAFRRAADGEPLISPKDRGGLTLRAWADDPRSANFPYP